jgi:2-isopropylmalate synthase
VVTAGTQSPQTAVITIDLQGQHVTTQATSTKGPLDAIAGAIRKAIPHEARLLVYRAKSLEPGTDAKGLVSVRLEIEGKQYRATSVDVDTNLAFARAYLGAVKQSRFMCP